MANIKKDEEEKVITGLETARNEADTEYDLVKSLLEAANYENDPDLVTTIDLCRNGKFLFSFGIHPLGDEEVKALRKRATTYMPNPANRKLPKIEKDFNDGLFNSLIIYAATIEEDKKKIWGNPTIMQKFDLLEPYESINKLLTVGEKADISSKVVEISGLEDGTDTITEEEYVKN